MYLILQQGQIFPDVLTLYILRVDCLFEVLAKEWSQWRAADGEMRRYGHTHKHDYMHTSFWGATRFKQLSVTALRERLLRNAATRLPTAALEVRHTALQWEDTIRIKTLDLNVSIKKKRCVKTDEPKGLYVIWHIRSEGDHQSFVTVMKVRNPPFSI